MITTKSRDAPGWSMPGRFPAVVADIEQSTADSWLKKLQNQNGNTRKLGLNPPKTVFLLKHLLVFLAVVAFRGVA